MNPFIIAPYEIVGQFEKVASEIDLLADIAATNLVFDISFLNKCVSDPTLIHTLESIGVKDSFPYEEVPIEILDTKVRKLRYKEVALVKYLWKN